MLYMLDNPRCSCPVDVPMLIRWEQLLLVGCMDNKFITRSYATHLTQSRE